MFDGIELTDVVVSNRKRHAVGSGRAADVGEERVVDTVVRLVGAYVAAEIVVRKMAGTTSFDVPAVGAVPVLHTALHKEAGIALGGVLSPLPRIVVARLGPRRNNPGQQEHRPHLTRLLRYPHRCTLYYSTWWQQSGVIPCHIHGSGSPLEPCIQTTGVGYRATGAMEPFRGRRRRRNVELPTHRLSNRERTRRTVQLPHLHQEWPRAAGSRPKRTVLRWRG